MKVIYTFSVIPHYVDALLKAQQALGVEVLVAKAVGASGAVGRAVKQVQGKAYPVYELTAKKSLMGKERLVGLHHLIRREKPAVLVLGWPHFLQLPFDGALRRSLKKQGVCVLIREIPFMVPPYGGIRNYFKNTPFSDENARPLHTGVCFFLRQWLLAQVRKSCYAQAQGTLNYCSEALKVLPTYGVSKNHIHVTFNATDTCSLQQQLAAVRPECDKEPGSLLHVGRLVKWKRVDLLIEAVARLRQKHPHCHLNVVGDGPELLALQQQARTLGVEDAVRFAGALYAPDALSRHLCSAEIYVLAGMGGLSINDAMTAGLPIVCSRCDGTERDLVQHGVNGLFFQEGDVGSLTRRLDYLLSHPEECRKMGSASLYRINGQFNLQAVAGRYVAAFKEEIKNGYR